MSIRYEVIRVEESKETSLATYNDKKDADDMCERLNKKKNIYKVKEVLFN